MADEPALTDMSKAELRAEARSRGLSDAGTRHSLLQRLRASGDNDEQQPSVDPPYEASEEPESDDDRGQDAEPSRAAVEGWEEEGRRDARAEERFSSGSEGTVDGYETDPVEGGPSHDVGPDVLLNVANLQVDAIELEVDDLRAHVSLQAEVLDFVKLNVGVDALLRGVDLEIKGVEGQALLKVRLDNLRRIVDRVVTAIDRNPQVLEHLAGRVAQAVDDVDTALLAVGEADDGGDPSLQRRGDAGGQTSDSIGDESRPNQARTRR